jgi:hypothetical protein
MNRDIMLIDVSMCGPHSVQKCMFSKMFRRNSEKGIKGGKNLKQKQGIFCRWLDKNHVYTSFYLTNKIFFHSKIFLLIEIFVNN